MTENNEANIAVPEMKLELVPMPVSDVDRTKAFYEKAGFQRCILRLSRAILLDKRSIARSGLRIPTATF